MTSKKAQCRLSEVFERMLNCGEELQDSDLIKIIEAIDDFLFHENVNTEKESNNQDGKRCETDLNGIKGWLKKIKSVGKKIWETFDVNIDTAGDVLETIGKLHWSAFGFVLVASVLHKWHLVKRNKKECLRLLKSMTDLAKVVLELRPLPCETANTKAKIKDSMRIILKGALSCSKMMERKNSAGKLVKAPKSNIELLEIRQEIEELRSILHVHISVCIFKRLIEKEYGGTKSTVTDAQNGGVTPSAVYDPSSVANHTPSDGAGKRRRDTSNESPCPPETPLKRKKVDNTIMYSMNAEQY